MHKKCIPFLCFSRTGGPYDNTCDESFFATVKEECIYKRKYVTMDDVKHDIHRF